MKLFNYFAFTVVLLTVLVVNCGKLGTGDFLRMNTHFLLKNNMKNNPADHKQFAPKNLTAKDLPDQPIYFQGWIKYFSFLKTSSNKNRSPKYFFKNEAFVKQTADEEDTLNDDQVRLYFYFQYGPFRIPNESNFFAVAYEDRLNILTSRQTAFLKVVDSLSFDFIHTIPDDAHFKGGIKDLGKFSEGFCFEALTREPANGTLFTVTEKDPIPPKGVERIWYICSDNEKTKTKFMNLVIQLRLKKQHKAGLWFNLNSPKKVTTISGTITPPETPVVKDLRDGYWILLQDWSTCSQKCGGGKQFQHLMCVPPKNGGKPCEGENVRERTCNNHPCPAVHEATKIFPKEGEKEVMEKPIIKMMPISSRPLRYDKCHLKEGDAIYTKWDVNLGFNDNPNKIPTRLVMNEKTLSLYTDETLKSHLATFLLEKSKFKLVEKKPSCFVIESNSDKGEFCNIDSNLKVNFVEEWNYDFNLFKNQCKTEKKVLKLDDVEEKELQKELEKKIEAAKLDVVKERTKKIQQKVKDSPVVNKVEKLQETAMLAMKKELAIDGLLQKEELEREEQEARELQVQLEKEKQKDECLIKSIKEKELEDQFNLTKAEQEKELNVLREQAKQQILRKRQQVKAKIMTMRKRAERKKQLLNGEIQSLRTQVASKINRESREGNMNYCFKPLGTEEHKVRMAKYCKDNFAEESPIKYNECLGENTFCYVCCETEFGNMHLEQREKCYDRCETEPKETLKKKGSWQWVEPLS